MHDLYSELRRVARSAMAGNDQNKNMARIANEVADAILKDLGATDGATAIGRQINEAREFSRVLHETFDRGAVGRLLKRTLDGDTTIDPELSMERTVGRGGAAGSVAADQIVHASGDTAGFMEDYLWSRFQASAFGPDGVYKPRAAQDFMRNNAELMRQFLQLRSDLLRSSLDQGRVTRAQSRAAAVTEGMNDPRQSPTAAFISDPTSKGVPRILAADRPARAAAEIVRTARKDKTGAALSGIKGAFSRHLIESATSPQGEGTRISGQTFLSNLSRNAPTLNQVFTPDEMGRLRQIGTEMARLDRAHGGKIPEIGPLSTEGPNKVVEMLLRIAAARRLGWQGRRCIAANRGHVIDSDEGSPWEADERQGIGTAPGGVVDLSSGNLFLATLTGNTTISFINPPAAVIGIGFTIQVISAGAHTIAWPASVRWRQGKPQGPPKGRRVGP